MHLQHYVNSINECFHHRLFFHKFLNYFLIFQSNGHVEMNKLLCSLASTWMTVIDSQFYII